jgi:hypothetical protein
MPKAFACNAVSVGRAVVMNACSGALALIAPRPRLEPQQTPADRVIKAGGAASA